MPRTSYAVLDVLLILCNENRKNIQGIAHAHTCDIDQQCYNFTMHYFLFEVQLKLL